MDQNFTYIWFQCIHVCKGFSWASSIAGLLRFGSFWYPPAKFHATSVPVRAAVNCPSNLANTKFREFIKNKGLAAHISIIAPR
jgi:hypothetical protein